MAFPDPINWAHEWANEQSESYYQVQDEMENYKKDAIKRFNLIAPNFSEAIAATIAFGHREGLTEATNIVEYLFLNEKHIAALNDDSEKMDDLLYKEREEDLAFEKYMARQYE